MKTLILSILLLIGGISITYCQSSIQFDNRVIILLPVKNIDSSDIALLFGGYIYSSYMNSYGQGMGQNNYGGYRNIAGRSTYRNNQNLGLGNRNPLSFK